VKGQDEERKEGFYRPFDVAMKQLEVPGTPRFINPQRWYFQVALPNILWKPI
jgi:hypothetical protein